MMPEGKLEMNNKIYQFGYVNFYGGGQVGAMWPDRETADARATQGRIACKFIEVFEGEYDE